MRRVLTSTYSRTTDTYLQFKARYKYSGPLLLFDHSVRLALGPVLHIDGGCGTTLVRLHTGLYLLRQLQ